MINELKFVQGAVSKKDFVPAMSHFQMHNQCIKSFNGTITISTPIECDLTCNPNAEQIVKAISKCGKHTTLTLTPTGRLSVKSEGFRAVVECFPDAMATPEPAGTFYQVDGEGLYSLFNMLYPIVGEDATRSWANGILLTGNYAYATNNVILARSSLQGKPFPPVNIPKAAIREVLRINKPCHYLQVDKNSITFHYDRDKWLRTTLLDLGWPDADNIIPKDFTQCTPIPESFFKQLEHLKDFTDEHGRVYLFNHTLSTRNLAQADNNEVKGCDVHVPDLVGSGAYGYEMLNRLKGVATHIHFNAGGKSPFYGEGVQGAIIGVRV
jgi:DNA polymerase III sliding clamp (beta) subunit (PCNA family)